MKPLLRGHFHQAMFFIALGGLIPLLLRCHNKLEYIAISIYSLCALAMFGISSLYHRIHWNPKQRLLWKKLDHAGIYLMIAGSVTPIALLGLGNPSSQKILFIFWGIALLGILQSLFFVNMPKLLSAFFYLVAGYMITPYLTEINQQIGSQNILFIILGGICYSLGALCYGFKWPKLVPHVLGYHEVFHLFVNFGAAFHFLVIHSLIHS